PHPAGQEWARDPVLHPWASSPGNRVGPGSPQRNMGRSRPRMDGWGRSRGERDPPTTRRAALTSRLHGGVRYRISEQTYYRWKKRFGDLGTAEVPELRQLREENRELKQVAADLMLDKQILKEALAKTC